MEDFFKLFSELSNGLGITLALFALTLLISIPLGFFGSQVSLSKHKAVRGIYNVYLVLMRGTPLILQVLFLYFGLGLLGIKIDRFTSALISFVLNYTAYYSEIFRGGIQSINKGQYEACTVLGMNNRLAMRKIVIPQVFKIVMPSMGNEVLNLVKDTALVSIIALGDLLKMANSAAMREASIIPFVVAALFYLGINAIATIVLKRIEKKMGYYRI